MIDKTLARVSRRTTATFTIFGAPKMAIGPTRFFGGRWHGFPFEVDVTWVDGSMDMDVTVRGWVMNADGTPRRYLTGRVDLTVADQWLHNLLYGTPEPGGVSAEDIEQEVGA